MKYHKLLLGWLAWGAIVFAYLPATFAQPLEPQIPAAAPPESGAALPSSDMLEVTPNATDQSPVLQRWMQSVPDVSADIRNDPSFTTRTYAGYSVFPSSDGTDGFVIGVEDWFVGSTPLTVSADYQQNFSGDRQAYGADFHYYVLPLGGYFNVAPTLGYRHAKSADDYSVSGANVGLRLRFVPSRTGAADLTLDQSWILGDHDRLSITQLTLGYAVSQNLRISTDLEWQRTADEGDSRVGINWEWAL